MPRSMLPAEILRKVRRIEIRTNRLVTESLAGQYHSVFKGRGMEFAEARDVLIGGLVRRPRDRRAVCRDDRFVPRA